MLKILKQSFLPLTISLIIINLLMPTQLTLVTKILQWAIFLSWIATIIIRKIDAKTSYYLGLGWFLLTAFFLTISNYFQANKTADLMMVFLMTGVGQQLIEYLFKLKTKENWQKNLKTMLQPKYSFWLIPFIIVLQLETVIMEYGQYLWWYFGRKFLFTTGLPQWWLLNKTLIATIIIGLLVTFAIIIFINLKKVKWLAPVIIAVYLLVTLTLINHSYQQLQSVFGQQPKIFSIQQNEQQLLIEGTMFGETAANDSQVLFNNQPIEFISWTQREITIDNWSTPSGQLQVIDGYHNSSGIFNF